MTVEVQRFLKTVVTTSEGWFCLLTGPHPDNRIHEEWFEWPRQFQTGEIEQRAETLSRSMNVWFSPHLFAQRDSHKEYVLPTRTIVADLDYADITKLSVLPTILIETSPGRHQGYWVVKEDLPLAELEAVSKRLTYNIENCDHSGWPVGHKFRFPGTKNFKYPNTPLVDFSSTSYQITSTDIILGVTHEVKYNDGSIDADDEWINSDHNLDLGIGPQELFLKFRSSLSPTALLAFTKAGTPSRSEGRWALMTGLFRAGATKDEVYLLTQASPNNSYADNAYGGERDLAKDVDRARREVEFESRDIGVLIENIIRTPGNSSYKSQVVSKTVITDLERNGEFVVTDDGFTWYLHRLTGRPISISNSSEYFSTLLDVKYRLNKTERLTKYVTAACQAFAIDRGRKAVPATLSYVVDDTSLLVHGGGADVTRVTDSGEQEKMPDGSYGVLFPWRIGDEPFNPQHRPELFSEKLNWCEFMFEGFFENIEDMSAQEAKALMRVYIIFLLFKERTTTRPLLAVFGQPGSGKTTILKMIYALIYGSKRDINSPTNPDDFDSLVSTLPFAAFDNADSPFPWLPDRLALSAGRSDLIKRKLYTDNDIVVVKRQALVAISAHNPKFGREDVVDRMLMLNFERISRHGDESSFINRVLNNRNAIWAELLEDAARVMREPMPTVEEVPAFRIVDFSMWGIRIARALGIEEKFRGAMQAARFNQTQFNLSEEDILTSTIRTWHSKRIEETLSEDRFYTATQLFEMFSLFDESFRPQYKNPIQFNKKLWTLQDSLKSVFDITFQFNSAKQTRLWRIEPLPDA